MKLMLKWGLLAAVLTVFVGSTPAQALFTGSLGPASKCIAGKAKCVIKKKSCLLGCHKKALAKALPLDAACLAKCHDKFDGGLVSAGGDPAKGCFAKLEAKIPSTCGLSVGDVSAFECKIDAHVLDIVAELTPTPNSLATGKCVGGKTGCIKKYNACVLGLVSKAAGSGGTIASTGGLTKCRDGLTSCIGKQDAKHPDTPCLTLADAISLRNKDDAFVDDVIAELLAGPQEMDTQRCSGDTEKKCLNAPNGAGGICTGFGLCQFFFGAPLPLAAGGVATCVTNQWAGGIAGTFNQQTGASAGTASVLANVYSGIDIPNPCPRCVGDLFPNDGSAVGTCSGGARDTLGCDANGQSAEPSFGSTSLDCPPTGLLTSIAVDLSNSTGTVTKTVVAAGPNCTGTPGDECLCGVCSGDTTRSCQTTAAHCTPFAAGTCGFSIGEPGKANGCVDSSTIPGDGTLCAATGAGDGACLEGPIIQHCNIETFRSCPCVAPGDTCGTFTRECFPGYNGVVNDTISSVGATSTPRNHTGTQTFASVFCIAPTGQPAIDAAAGLPGPGRLQLGGCGNENGGVACPTEASFLPNFKGGVLDTGWTGVAHDAKVISQGKVTVGVTSCAGIAPNCGICSYTGPVPN